jgi:hypothetical protein
MAEDVVERLRAEAVKTDDLDFINLMTEAADLIERLRADADKGKELTGIYYNPQEYHDGMP